MELIGRMPEIELLHETLQSAQSEMLAVYGRRRVGKTFLIRTIYKKEIIFSISGIHNANLSEQLYNFSLALNDAKKSRAKAIAPTNWIDAFQELKDFVISKKSTSKKVLFFDELPWLDTPKSNFLQALDHFWNSWAAHQKNIVLVICGSAASWMIQKILNNKGGLHNRVTKRIRLLPFTLKETEQFLSHKKIKLDHYAIAQLYMAMGGIPFYLNEIKKGESVTQNIERICFSKDGLLRSEFQNLYHALFNNSDKHVKIIKALASSHKGLSRNEIIKKTKLNTGGGVSILLNELLESGFISEIKAHNKFSKDNIFRLTDEYSLFYLKFIETNSSSNRGIWKQLCLTQNYSSWCGYAYENICFKHSESILKALGIQGISSTIYSWQNKNAQIDMLIDRGDNSITICEIKFYNTPFTITKSYNDKLVNKINSFKNETKIKKNIFILLISSFGLIRNKYAEMSIDNELSLNNLFN